MKFDDENMDTEKEKEEEAYLVYLFTIFFCIHLRAF